MDDDFFVNPKDRIEEMLLGKEGVAKKRRAAELEHQRDLARIRAESHALVWIGTSEELTAKITRWYESGWIRAESLLEALQKAAIHFADPSGRPIITPATIFPGAQASRVTKTSTDTANHEVEVERRKKLLAEYKAATKNPSNKRIYEAANSEIHKPQFHRWVKGSLPADSSTTINFERFLR